MEKYSEKDCVNLLCEKYNMLQQETPVRYPKRSDFTEEEVCAIKAHLGPWPRALEKAGIKPPKENTTAIRSREKRIRAKRRRTEKMKSAMKKTGLLVLVFFLLTALFGESALAGNIADRFTKNLQDVEDATESATVYVTISDGTLQLASVEVETFDIDGDGSITISDALYMAHEKHYPGGAETGYFAEQTDYGLSMTKLWGVQNGGAYGYYLNNGSPLSLADTVKDGDCISAFVYKDTMGFSDTYVCFDFREQTVEEGESLTVCLSKIAYDENWNMVTLPVQGAVITANGTSLAVKTDADGKALLTLSKEGLYCISAESEEELLVPPACLVTVSKKEDSSRQIFGGIYSRIIGEESGIEGWMYYSSLSPLLTWEEKLVEEAGTNADWYMIGLMQKNWPSTGYEEKYVLALKEYLEQKNNTPSVTKERIALTCIACGFPDLALVTEVAQKDIGAQGLMSYVYGLILISNGAQAGDHTATSVISEILSCQLPDGGWALSGSNADVDVTAMTLQALAPYYEANEVIRKAVDAGVACLAKKQLASGEFQSYGVANAESTAQVIMALSALDIDAGTDERFVKNGKTLAEVLKSYQKEDGRIAHTVDGEGNALATAQAFLACISAGADGRNRVNVTLFYPESVPVESVRNFDFSKVVKQDDTQNVNDGTTDTKDSQNSGREDNAKRAEESSRGKVNRVKAYILLGIAVLVVITLLVLIWKKKDRKFFVIVILIGVLACGGVVLSDIRTPGEYYGRTGEKKEAIGKVTLTICCDRLKGTEYANVLTSNAYISEDGMILPKTEYWICEGDTVYDILFEAAQKKNLQLDHSGAIAGSEKLVYLNGIQYLYEAQCGDLSGWVYHVNGETPAKSCGDYELHDGDDIVWLYSLELGNDVLER